MGGGLMQLVAYGAQDAFLTGNPEITFFKVVYRRHTNFALESIVQDFNGSGTRLTATISRNGDLVTNCWLEDCASASSGSGATTVPARNGTANIESVDLEIGGQRIDKHYGQWMEIWSELTCPVSKRAGFDTLNAAGTVPLQFFFCRNPGLALPLIALQYHEVKLTFNLKAANTNPMKLFVDYVYLDTDERRRFAQVQHNMLIDQLQQQDGAASGQDTRLNFNHPCKELVWTTADGDTGDTTLKLNGHDRFQARSEKYFQLVQPYQHHSNVPLKVTGLPDDGNSVATSVAATVKNLAGVEQRINVYSFALKPEEHQPSGTCNFSRIDNAQLKSALTVDKVYAVNYNVLRIMSGMGGLAFSN